MFCVHSLKHQIAPLVFARLLPENDDLAEFFWTGYLEINAYLLKQTFNIYFVLEVAEFSQM